MTTRVPRHGNAGPDDVAYAEFLGASLREEIEYLETRPQDLNSTFNTAMLHLGAQLAVEADGSGIGAWEALTAAMQIASAVFDVAAIDTGAVDCLIDHKVVRIPATGPTSTAAAPTWITAFWLAVVCRDQARMNRLCNIPLDLLRASGATHDEYQYHWVDSLQSYWLEKPGLAEKLTATFELSHPDRVVVAPADLLGQQLFPPINLFYQFFRHNTDGFNQALLEALEAHKAYWTDDDDREGSVEGYLALGPLAITCIAHDAGRPITVESDYLPEYFLNREWVGEFPT